MFDGIIPYNSGRAFYTVEPRSMGNPAEGMVLLVPQRTVPSSKSNTGGGYTLGLGVDRLRNLASDHTEEDD